MNKKSSDELLRKFAESDDEGEKKKSSAAAKRRRRRLESGGAWGCESPLSGGLAERRSLLPAAPRKKAAVLRQLGIRGRAPLRAREIRHKSLFGAIQKVSSILIFLLLL